MGRRKQIGFDPRMYLKDHAAEKVAGRLVGTMRDEVIELVRVGVPKAVVNDNRNCFLAFLGLKKCNCGAWVSWSADCKACTNDKPIPF